MFHKFLYSLKRPHNASLIEAISKGYQTIFESIQGKHLVVVDIQPDYQKSFTFPIEEFIQYINLNYDNMNNLTFLFNGPDLGFPDVYEYKYWLIENGLDERIIEEATFYDKGYAFFRYCMDEGMDEEQIVNLVKFMMDNDITDSREMNEEKWMEFIQIYGNEDIKELMQYSDDCINIPDLMDELKNYSNIVLTGGGINECLKEVEIALLALDKPYSVLNTYTY